MKKNYTLLVILGLSLVLNSCNKKGCSDPNADNYVSNVKKAVDKRCQYNGEGICGEGITFCFEINNVKRKGQAYFSANTSQGDNYKQIFWSNGQPSSSAAYEDVIIRIYGNKESSSYTLSNSGQDRTFTAEYYSGQNGIVQNATSGSLTVKRDNDTDGLIATFNFETAGVNVNDGNIYKLKN